MQAFGEPALALADVTRAGVVGAVGEPQREVAAAGAALNLDGVEDVGERRAAGFRIGIAERAVLVDLVLEEVGVDGAEPDAALAGGFFDFGHIGDAVGEVPQDVQGDGRAAAGEVVDLAGVGELLGRGGSRGGLEELAETGAGVGEAPGGQFDSESVERLEGEVMLARG